MDEEHPQVFVPALADPEQLRFAAGRMLLRHETEPSAQVASAAAEGGPRGCAAEKVLESLK